MKTPAEVIQPSLDAGHRFYIIIPTMMLSGLDEGNPSSSLPGAWGGLSRTARSLGIMAEEQAGQGQHLSARPLIPWFPTQKTKADEAAEGLNPAGFSAPDLHARCSQR